MRRNVAHKLIESHLVEGELIPGQEIGIRIDQTLTQDATLYPTLFSFCGDQALRLFFSVSL